MNVPSEPKTGTAGTGSVQRYYVAPRNVDTCNTAVSYTGDESWLDVSTKIGHPVLPAKRTN